jgi:hypothetical protein
MINSIKKITIISMVPLFAMGPNPGQRPKEEPIVLLEPKPIEKIETKPIEKIEPKIEELIVAMIQVESRGSDSAIGDTHLGEPSVGVLQLRPIMVREVNRILKKQKSEKRYKLKDRFSREKSIEMFMVWKNYYHPENEFETIARNWNGGPNGYKKSRTEKYWAKVQLELNK